LIRFLVADRQRDLGGKLLQSGCLIRLQINDVDIQREVTQRTFEHRYNRLADDMGLCEFRKAPVTREPITREDRHDGVRPRNFAREPAPPIEVGQKPAVFVKTEGCAIEPMATQAGPNALGELVVSARMAKKNSSHASIPPTRRHTSLRNF